VAIYGNGDQKGYPENFCDAVGLMADIVEAKGAKVIGYTLQDGYTYESSKAARGDQFCGLAIDFENQAKQNNSRIKAWVEQLKKEFN
jgi:flavodoxin I